ncbi:MAG: hypothetical protein KA753_02810, partial [Paludibacter sp.]|nr:hypothetical protein [Paludibacter sp.]
MNSISHTLIKTILLYSFIIFGHARTYADTPTIPAIVQTLVDSFNRQSDEHYTISANTNNHLQTQLIGTTNRPKDFLTLKESWRKRKIEFTDSVRLQSNPALGDKV